LSGKAGCMKLARTQLPDVEEFIEEVKKPSKKKSIRGVNKEVYAEVQRIATQPNIILSEEITPMIAALNKVGVDEKAIALSLKKLMKAKKTVFVGPPNDRREMKLPDNGIILAATKFAAILRNAIPAKKVTGKFSHLHANIPKNADTNILREREKFIKETHEAEFEVLDDPIN